MIRRIVLIVMISVMTQNAFAIPLDELVPAQAAQLRQSDELVLEAQIKAPSPKLLPNDNELEQVFNTVMKDLAPTVLVESLYLYKKPQSAHTNPHNWSEDQKIVILNQLLAISSLAGIQYYSASRGSMRTFYETSRVIDNPSGKRPQPDPVYTDLPASVSIYTRQKDLTFGDNVYKYDFKAAKNSVFFIQENVTALTYGIIPVIGKNNLKTILAVFDCGDSLLIYGASMAKVASVMGMEDRVGNSFGNRANAMLRWLSERMNNYFDK